MMSESLRDIIEKVIIEEENRPVRQPCIKTNIKV